VSARGSLLVGQPGDPQRHARLERECAGGDAGGNSHGFVLVAPAARGHVGGEHAERCG